MSSTAPFDQVELAAWQGMLRTHALVIRAVDERLAREHGLLVSEFDVLITLASAANRELRMTELAERVMLSPSGLTRLVGRLERHGLVRRRPAADDGRSYLSCLTEHGLAKLEQACPTHNAVIRELFLDRIGHRDRTALVRAWRAIDNGADPRP